MAHPPARKALADFAMLQNKNKIQKEILKLTKKLIRFETLESRPDQLEAIIKYSAAYFKGSSLFIKKYHYKKKPSLVITTKKTKRPHVLLSGHLDVVPGNPADFKPQVSGNKLYGRGAADMKTACATMMYLMKVLAEQKIRQSVGLALTTDEETEHYNGTFYLMEKRSYRPKVVVLPDGGYNFQLVTAQKGVIRFTLIAHSAGAHSSRPWLGRSAIKQIFKAYRDMRQDVPEPKNEHDWRLSILLTKLMGGEAFNRVPASCEAYFDLRYTEDNDLQYWERYLAKLAKRYNLELKLDQIAGAFLVDPEHDLVKQFRAISQSVLRKQLTLTPEAGASDANHYAVHNIPVIISSLKGGNPHADNEWVDITSIYKFYQILNRYLEEVG